MENFAQYKITDTWTNTLLRMPTHSPLLPTLLTTYDISPVSQN